MVNGDGSPPSPTDPTDSTYGCHQDGTDTAVTPARPAGFDWHAAPPDIPTGPVLPAAATTTTSLSVAA